jgi:hypothetical protein
MNRNIVTIIKRAARVVEFNQIVMATLNPYFLMFKDRKSLMQSDSHTFGTGNEHMYRTLANPDQPQKESCFTFREGGPSENEQALFGSEPVDNLENVELIVFASNGSMLVVS